MSNKMTVRSRVAIAIIVIAISAIVWYTYSEYRAAVVRDIKELLIKMDN